MTYIKGQTVRWRREGDRGSFGEVEDIASGSLDLLPSSVGNFELALENYLHLMIRVCVHQRGALLETIETAGDGLFRVVRLASRAATISLDNTVR